MEEPIQRPPLRKPVPVGDVVEVEGEVVRQDEEDFRAFTIRVEGRINDLKWKNCHWDPRRKVWWHWLFFGTRVAVWEGKPPPRKPV